MLHKITTEIALNSTIRKIVHIKNLINSWYLSGELIHISILKKIQICDIDILISAYASSGSFGSIVSSKSIIHNKYTGRRSISR